MMSEGEIPFAVFMYEVEAELDEKQHQIWAIIGKCTRRKFRGIDLVPTLIYYIYQDNPAILKKYWKIFDSLWRLVGP